MENVTRIVEISRHEAPRQRRGAEKSSEPTGGDEEVRIFEEETEDAVSGFDGLIVRRSPIYTTAEAARETVAGPIMLPLQPRLLRTGL